MKYILTLLILIFSLFSFSQIPEVSHGKFTVKNSRYYRININGTETAFLTNITDSSLQLSQKEKAYGTPLTGMQVLFSEIEEFKLRDRSSISKGALFGAITGIILGGIIGYASYKKPTPDGWITIDFGPGMDAVAGAFLGGIIGSLTGVLIGTNMHHYIINRSQEKFRETRAAIIKAY